MNKENMDVAYSEAKRALNASAPERVICRAKENAELEAMLVDVLESSRPLSLYVNGQPGTGKTLSVTHTLDKLKSKYKFKKLMLNCMTIKTAQCLYKYLVSEISSADTLVNSSTVLTPSKRATSKDALGKNVEALITSLRNHLVLVLDEVDQIETCIKNPADFYKIFNWPFLPNSKLVLIGIANSLDFTERILPRLELKPECKPRTIKFLPYSKEDIIQIVKDRLSSVNSTIIDNNALTLCASKIASTSGDIRRVLDICRRAIEYIEQESKLNGNLKTVGIGQMMRIFNEVNPMTNSNLDRSAMPLLQKILLCTILLCTKDMKIKEITYSKLLDKFNRVCKAYNTEAGSDSELMGLCTCLQDNGLIDVKKAKEIRNYKFTLKLDEQELRDRLQDETFMSGILNGKF